MKEKRYFPSNGSERCAFTEYFCMNCTRENYLNTGNDGSRKCQILSNSMLFDIPAFDKDLNKDKWEWVYNDKNESICLQFNDKREIKRGKKRRASISKGNLELF